MRIIRGIWKELLNFPLLCYCILFAKSKSIILVQAWCKYKAFPLFRKDPLIHNNWGDDINYYFLPSVIGKKIILYPNTILSRLIAIKRYSMIGSLLTIFNLKNTVICGSGILNNNRINISGNPQKIHFVRGPLTREVLVHNNYNCPECYGDLALLLPLYYKPMKKNKWKICIIPHYKDFDTEIVQKIIKEDISDIHIIKMKGYEQWTDIIDDICSCDVVISSSLHGLIVSETYKIPCFWVYLSKYVDGWDFKFKDFYGSIGKKQCLPISVNRLDDIYLLYERRIEWKEGFINYQSLLNMLHNSILS